jgi:hypothetical protein
VATVMKKKVKPMLATNERSDDQQSYPACRVTV